MKNGRSTNLRDFLRISLLATSFAIWAAGQRTASAPAGPAQVSPSCLSGAPGTLSVTGYGEAEAVADTGKVSVSISNLNATADGARRVAAETATAVIAAITEIAGLQPDNVTTTSVSVQPKYSSGTDMGTRRIEGYTFTNSLSIDISNLTNDLLSQVLDTAVKTGANRLTINSVAFSLSPALAGNLTIEAERMAVREARGQADRYATNLGTTLGAALTVNTSPPPQPIQTNTNTMTLRSTTSNDVSETTPVAVSKKQVEVSVSIVFTICTPQS